MARVNLTLNTDLWFSSVVLLCSLIVCANSDDLVLMLPSSTDISFPLLYCHCTCSFDYFRQGSAAEVRKQVSSTIFSDLPRSVSGVNLTEVYNNYCIHMSR